jgi:hypothetical protein
VEGSGGFRGIIRLRSVADVGSLVYVEAVRGRIEWPVVGVGKEK